MANRTPMLVLWARAFALVSAYYKKVGNDKASATDDSDDTKSTQNTAAKSAAAQKKQYSSLASSAKTLGSDADKLMSSDKNSIFNKTWQNVTDEDGTESKVYDY